MTKIQGQSTSNATHVAQIATFAALTGTQEPVETMRKAFDERRIEMVKLLRAIPNVKCREPKGAFYAFPDVSAYVGKTTPDGKMLATDVELCDWLVDVGRVAVVPGSGFGAPGHVRLSYASLDAEHREGVGRLGRALAHAGRRLAAACLASLPFPARSRSSRRDRVVDILHIAARDRGRSGGAQVAGTATLRAAVTRSDHDSSSSMRSSSRSIASPRTVRRPAFRHDGKKLRIELDAELAPGGELVLAIDYRGAPRRGLYFTAPDEGYPAQADPGLDAGSGRGLALLVPVLRLAAREGDERDDRDRAGGDVRAVERHAASPTGRPAPSARCTGGSTSRTAAT